MLDYGEGTMNTLHQLILRDVEILFHPFHHRKIELPTRVVVAEESIPQGMRTQGLLFYYRRRATSEVGLILTAGVLIDDPAAAADWCSPLFYGGRALRLWKQIVQTVHTTNSKIAPLLHHAGMCRPTQGNIPHPEQIAIGPSGISPFTLQHTGEEMGHARIEQVAEAYARAAATARSLHFDAVEINGAAGSLIDQFFRASTNKRTDIYSSADVARTRFATKILHTVRKAVGKSFPIIFRYSQHGIGKSQDEKLATTPEALADFLLPLSEAGADMFHCSGSHFAEPAFEGSGLNLAGWTRIITGKPTISSAQEATLSQNQLQKLYTMMRSGVFDLAALAGELQTNKHAQ